ncbi:MAG: carboxypeptidase-like regulatory domain-containing protein [Deltaproteobacteria bacterium]|nr:carboxypeptidase-like regulatory domain-containing protein [Deltaproteobacteria bacterium]
MSHKECPECSAALECPGHGAVQRPLVAPCSDKRGGLWVSVHDTAGVEVPGVPVAVDGRTVTTDATGLAAFDPLEQGAYTIELGTLPTAVAERFALPAVPRIDGLTVTKGKIELADMVLRRRPTLEVKVSPATDAEVIVTHGGSGKSRSAKTRNGTVDFGVVEVGVYNVRVQRNGDGNDEHQAEEARVEMDYEDRGSVAVELADVVNPLIDVDDNREALAVRGDRLTVTLRADGPFQGRGQLRVTAGANHIRVYEGNQALAMNNNRHDFAQVDEDGVVVELEAIGASAYEGVTLEWELLSNTIQTGPPATTDLTAVEATLVIHDANNQPLARPVATGTGRVLLRGDAPRPRARITIACLPTEFEDQLRLIDRNGGAVTLHAAAAGGNAMPLPHRFDTPLPPQLYVEGIRTSAGAGADALDLAIIDMADRADHVVLTVAEASLEVCGPRPAEGEPPPLAAAVKRNPGRALIGQPWSHTSPRALVRVRKTPVDAPCTLRLRAGAAIALRHNERHTDGEVATALPRSITATAFAQAHTASGDGLVLWAEGAGLAATPTPLSLDIEDVADDCDAVGFTVEMATVDVAVERSDEIALTGEVRVQLYPPRGDEVLFSEPVDAAGKVQFRVPPASYRVGVVPADGLAEAAFRILRKPDAAAPGGVDQSLTVSIEAKLGTATSLDYELAPPYDKVQFIGYRIVTGPYMGTDQPAPGGDADVAVDTDITARCDIMKAAIEYAQDQTDIDPAATTLKVFMGPEFFFRGKNGAYPVETLSTIPHKMRQETEKTKYKDWMFVLGTGIGSRPECELVEHPGTATRNNENSAAFSFECPPDSPLVNVAIGWSVRVSATGNLWSTHKGVGRVNYKRRQTLPSGNVRVLILCEGVPTFPVERKPWAVMGQAMVPGFKLYLQPDGATTKHRVPSPEVSLCYGSVEFDCAHVPRSGSWKGYYIGQGEFRGYITDSVQLPGGSYRVNYDRLTKEQVNNGRGVTLIDPRKTEIFNVAFVQQGGTATSMSADGHGLRDAVILKESISSIDFEGRDYGDLEFNEEHAHLATLDGDPMTRLIPTLGSTDQLGVAATDTNMNETTDHGLGGGSIFTMHDIRFGLEVCLDHAKGRLRRHFTAGEATAGERQIQVHLIPSCGMSINAARCRPNTLVFNADRVHSTASRDAGANLLIAEDEVVYDPTPVPAGIDPGVYFPQYPTLPAGIKIYPALDKPAPTTV